MTPKKRIIRCPVHNLIRIDCPYALQIMESQSMQRLRKIRQLGLAYLVYPGAEHSRFSHSLGAYHLANQMVDKLNEDGNDGEKPFSAEYKTAVCLAALVHDIGHGPFSHLFEKIAKTCLGKKAKDHEGWTIEILKNDPAIESALSSASTAFGIDAPAFIRDTVKHTLSREQRYMGDIVSSQMDVDRFDYLLRDSLMTGVEYGKFDTAWIYRNLKIGTIQPDSEQPMKAIVIDGRRGLSSIESYLLGCFYMYQHVYYHKAIHSAESMLLNILKRAVDILKEGRKDELGDVHPALVAFSELREPTFQEYLSLNDFRVLTWVEDWAQEGVKDPILKDLSQRLMERNIFGCIRQPEDPAQGLEKYTQIQRYLDAKNLDPTYYLIDNTPSRDAYKDLLTILEEGKTDEDHQPIHVEQKMGGIHPLSAIESLVIRSKPQYKIRRWFVPKEHVQDIAHQFGLTQL
jgi:HD superfamily phosphohydrolase